MQHKLMIDCEQPVDRAAGAPLLSLSVIVCTYNRCDKLRQALQAIDAADHPEGCSIELVVVDNNSTDDTKFVIQDFARMSALPVQQICEAAQGISFARNRGIREAKGTVVAFADDDCIVDRGWIATVFKEFIENPDLFLIGGRVDLHSPQDRPISIRPLGKRVRYRGPEYLFSHIMGCNFAFRRTLVERIGLFDLNFGGTNGVAGDDVEFIYRAVRMGLRVEFVPEMKVRHDHGRRTDAIINKLQNSYVRGRGAFYCKYALCCDVKILRCVYWEVAGEVRLIAKGLRTKRAIRPNILHLKRLVSGAMFFIKARFTHGGG